MLYGRQEWVCMIQIFNMCQYSLNSLVLLTITDMVLIYRASRTAYVYNIYYLFLPANGVQCKNLEFTVRGITHSLARCFSISRRRLAHSPVQISLCRNELLEKCENRMKFRPVYNFLWLYAEASLSSFKHLSLLHRTYWSWKKIKELWEWRPSGVSVLLFPTFLPSSLSLIGNTVSQPSVMKRQAVKLFSTCKSDFWS